MPHDLDIFGPGVPLKWLPDETLFSLCSRFHRLSGNRLAATTCKMLFGHRTQGSAHDLPSRIGHFATVTGSVLGNADTIIRERTVLPFYLHFTSAERADAAVAAMGGESIGSLKFQLGLLTSRFRANHPLKACQGCMQEDARAHATSYWHFEHQLPGAWVCLKHLCPLTTADIKATGVGRFQWFLPRAEQFRPPRESVVHPSLVLLTRNAVGLARLSQETIFDAYTIHATYRQALRARGLMRGARQRQLELSEIGIQYAAHLSGLRLIEELAALPSDERSAAAEIGRLVGTPRSGIHPIRHLALITWLFSDFDVFVARYMEAAQQCESPGPAVAASADTNSAETRRDLRQAFKVLLESGHSVSSAARKMGIDPATGMAWAAGDGISVIKRPSIIRDEVRVRMIKALKAGRSKQAVANLGGVSVVSVSRLLRTEVGLRECWRSARFRRHQRSAQRRWLRATASNPISGVKAARMIEPAAYAWLYRNDKAWLDEQVAKMTQAVGHSGLQVDWDTRDEALATEVRRLALDLATEMPGRTLRLWQLYQRLPELKAKLSRLDRLPRTRQAIYSSLRPQKQG